MESPSDPSEFQRRFFARHPSLLAVMELFEFLPNAHFYAKDRQSRFVKVNRAVLERLGLTSELDMIGRNDHAFHPPTLARAYIQEDQRVMDSRRPLPQQAWLVGGSSTQTRWFLSSKTPLVSAEGEVVGLAGVMYPISTPRDREVLFREVLPVVQHMESHYRDEISMQRMASMAGLSATHFNRRFRELVGMRPTQYVQTLRLLEAQRLLVETRESIRDVAQRAGFYDQSHLTRQFRRATGITPLAYRRRFRRDR